MIDWYTGLIGYDASGIDTGRVLIVSPGGEITFSTDRWIKAVGSYNSTIQLRPASCTLEMLKSANKHDLICSDTCLEVSGNPSKFLQGHNVFGPSVSSLGPVVQGIIRALPGQFRPKNADDPRWPALNRRRVDVTTSIRMGNHREVHDFISHAQTEMRSHHRKQQSGLTGASTVSWGAGSDRWMLTAYCKLCELLKHPLADPLMNTSIGDFADGLLRIELRLYTKELKPKGTLFESIIWEYYDRIEVGVMKEDVESKVLAMRSPVRMIYELWLDGHDVSPSSGYLKRAAFYKYRKEILEVTGQDISNLPVKKNKGDVSRDIFGSGWLKEHEVKELPDNLKKYLYEPGKSPVWERE